jgi:hypothetical protein
MAQGNLPGTNYYRISASGNVKTSQGTLLGVFVATTTGGTLTFYDDSGTGTSKTIVGTFTPNAGQFYPLPFSFANGLNVVVAGTIDATIAAV